ncbi:Crp/Fnr family transcriptional regulator [Clostridium gasigenes]|uniref:Crp/Fnr family transcriptional regulator n=1 Tax=Clostridium gasigenes TaxID=94869 RepID=UPI001C0B1257|nr:Crp/Fnr family transcriptional regulator [Clostridium gasigenes]MBU3135426.1 Crp/Fnr family transcriptional regulator [Clostridium gasigenes]
MKNRELDSLEIFNNILEKSKKELEDFGENKKIKKGMHLFRDKDNVNTIYIVASGKVALYKLNESAQKKIIFILGKGDIINAVILDTLPASINCEIFEDAEILCFERGKFIEVMKTDFELTTVVMNSLALKVRRMYRQMKNTTPIKVEKRVAAKLWKLSKDYGVENKEGTLIDLNISVTYLADMFGTPRETISRALKILQNEGLIIWRSKQIVVINKDKLSKFFKETTRKKKKNER